ncbi:MAG: hypothetical protein BWY63_01750 [Chloroflexi bacterium ADurb.Bin360]|nr:MAG: hypothetical protein BWY63_01750 [Chloroflexi bacterium ADurb.Bin360]
MLADIRHLKHKGIETRIRDTRFESRLVHGNATRRHDNSIQPMLLDILLNHTLSRIGTCITMFLSYDYTGQVLGVLYNFRRCYHTGNIGSAMAYIDANTRWIIFVIYFTCCFSHRSRSLSQQKANVTLHPVAHRPLAFFQYRYLTSYPFTTPQAHLPSPACAGRVGRVDRGL